MANLPITANNAPPAGGAANVLLANNAADAQAQAGDAQAGEPFARLLALQIDAADLFAPGGIQTASLADAAAVATTPGATADPAPKDGAETTNIADITNDPAAALAALFLQIPQPRSVSSEPKTEDASLPAITGRQTPESKTGLDGRFGTVHSRTSENVARQAVVDSTKEESGTSAQEANSPSLLQSAASPASSLPPDMLKRAESATAQLQSASSATQATNPATTPPPMIPMTGNRLADAPQAVATPFGSNGWADDFSQKISWMATQQNQVAELHLNPPDLGPLNVVLKISDNQATALFTSPHSAVRDAVENALPKLREMLADNGIMLGNTTVSDQSLPDRSAERFANQGSGTSTSREMPENDALKPAAQIAPMRRHNGMVDTFA